MHLYEYGEQKVFIYFFMHTVLPMIYSFLLLLQQPIKMH